MPPSSQRSVPGISKLWDMIDGDRGLLDRILQYSAKPGDSSHALRVKRLFVPSYIGVGLIASAVAAKDAASRGAVTDVYQVGMIVIAIALLFGALLPSLFTKVHPVRLVERVIPILAVAVMVMDWRNAAVHAVRFWSFAVLLVDLALVADSRSWVHKLIICVVMTALTLERIEAVVHYGLYQITFFNPGDLEVPACSCASPPCAEAAAGSITAWLGFAIVFGVDFHFTRMFANGLRKEQRATARDVRLAEHVAFSLVKFDLADAGRVLQTMSAGDSELKPAFEALIANLEVYRAYLPDSMLASAETPAEDEDEVAALEPVVDIEPPDSCDFGEPDCSFGGSAAAASQAPVVNFLSVMYHGNEPGINRSEVSVSSLSAAQTASLYSPKSIVGRRRGGEQLRSPASASRFGVEPRAAQGSLNSSQSRILSKHGSPSTFLEPPASRPECSISVITPSSDDTDSREGGPLAPLRRPSQQFADKDAPKRRGSGKGPPPISTANPQASMVSSVATGRDSEDYNVGAISPRPNVIGPCSPHIIAHARVGRQMQLDVGMRSRRSTVVEFLLVQKPEHGYDPATLQANFTACDPFVRRVLFAVGAEGGAVLTIGADTVVATWNAHRPCPRHAHQSLACADFVVGPRTGIRRTGCFAAAALGHVGFGHIGSDTQRAPFVFGHPWEQAHHLSALAARLSSPLLCTEKVHDLVSAHCVSLLVDAVPRDLVAGDSAGPSLLVYEVLSNRGGHNTPAALTDAVRALCAGDPLLAAEVCRAQLQNDTHRFRVPARMHAKRLLLLANAASIGERYVRRWVGWEDCEAPARDALERSLVSGPSTGAGLEEGAFEAGEGLGQGPSSARHSQEPADDGGLFAPSSTKLKADIQTFRESGMASAAGYSPAEDMQLPKDWTDGKGQRWRRANKMLGRGASGIVWLGMTDDGGLCAVKAVALPRNIDSVSAASGDADLRLQHAASTASADTSPAPTEPGDGGDARRASPPPPEAPLATELPRESTARSADRRRRSRKHVTQERDINELITEVSILERLQHDNIVCYLSSALVGRWVVLCMEYVPGGSLDAVITQFGTLPLSTVRRYTKEILQGLQYLHANGIVHRDFKPHNVLLQIDGLCKIADFGTSAELRKICGEVVGTPLYMAPEACSGNAISGSDIWGVGITVCQMLTGRVPYVFSESDPYVPTSFIYRLKQDASLRPVLPSLAEVDSPEVVDFVSLILVREANLRPSAEQLLTHVFLLG
eukprot:TRINITY_DN10500_c0_g1_i1.p1 TRINITY_DN10500_c0_g1~~TRINITY_DN10500_c0_g1_i1.p1  ORF type:complete len:1277 (+),score=379.67 TRINITY_DN10500_c0_g1_i1:108-3833(+)